MQTYKLYGLDGDGEFLFGREIHAASLDEACLQADAALAEAARVELWHGAVRVYHRRAGL